MKPTFQERAVQIDRLRSKLHTIIDPALKEAPGVESTAVEAQFWGRVGASLDLLDRAVRALDLPDREHAS